MASQFTARAARTEGDPQGARRERSGSLRDSRGFAGNALRSLGATLAPVLLLAAVVVDVLLFVISAAAALNLFQGGWRHPINTLRRDICNTGL